MTRHIAITTLAALSFVGNVAAQAPQPAGAVRTITNLRGDLYQMQDTESFVYNTVFLVTPEGIILADPIDLEASTWLKQELSKRFPNRPVKYVLPSHHHNDHGAGAGVFNDTAELVGHATFNAELKKAQTAISPMDRNKDGKIDKSELPAEGAATLLAMDRNGDGSVTTAEMNADVIPVESTYTDRRTITLGGKSAVLVHPGKAHSEDATVVYFPAERTVFAVDFVAVRVVPRGFGADTPEEVLAAVRAVEKLDFDKFVPGHGYPISVTACNCVGTKADVTAFASYIEDLVAGVQAGINAGQTVQQIQASNLLEKYKDWANYVPRRDANIAEVHATLMARKR